MRNAIDQDFEAAVILCLESPEIPFIFYKWRALGPEHNVSIKGRIGSLSTNSGPSRDAALSSIPTEKWTLTDVGFVPITTSPGLAAALSFVPATAITNAAALLNRAQTGLGQVVMFHRVFACGPQTMLRDGSSHLIALTSCWPILCVALDR